MAGPVAALCSADQARLNAADGRVIATFSIEIADDEAERAQGLMHRESMPRSAGMLFVYPSEEPVAFWMRNTLIPLDMIFFDSSGKFVSMQEQARPLDETPLPSEGPSQFVLEINGGLGRRLGIGPGTVLVHPAIDPEQATIPCR